MKKVIFFQNYRAVKKHAPGRFAGKFEMLPDKSKGGKISMTNQEIKDALMNYHRAPKLISEELEIIRNCESEREKFSPKSASISELPRGSSVNDKTYSDAVDGSKYFDEEIKFHRENNN